MKRFILLLFIILVASCKEHSAQSTIVSIDEFNVMVLGKDVQLVDVRTQEEFKEGHIDDAINIDYFEEETFAQKFSQFDMQQPIYIYCRSGNRSQKSAKILQELGFQEIFDLEGGYEAWNDSK